MLYGLYNITIMESLPQYTSKSKTIQYNGYILEIKDVEMSIKNKRDEYVLIDLIDKFDFEEYELSDVFEIVTKRFDPIDRMYIKQTCQSEKALGYFFGFKFEKIEETNSFESRLLRIESELCLSSEKAIVKYGIHESGREQMKAIQRAVTDGCVDYLQYALDQGYPFDNTKIKPVSL